LSIQKDISRSVHGHSWDGAAGTEMATLFLCASVTAAGLQGFD
jgi:hypothetical protein